MLMLCIHVQLILGVILSYSHYDYKLPLDLQVWSFGEWKKQFGSAFVVGLSSYPRRKCTYRTQLAWQCFLLVETFRFEDENDYEYEIWREVFSRILKI